MPEPTDILEELHGWGFGTGKGEHKLIADGAHLVYVDDEGGEYVLATSTYFGDDVAPHRPFLAVAIGALSAVESVLALHVIEYDDASGRNRCRECGYEDWTEPDCPTVRAIESALEGGDDAE